MWFKNLRVYRFTQELVVDAESLHDALSTNIFVPCGSQDTFRYGWVSPTGNKDEDASLVHASQGYYMVCAKKQEKVLPAAVVNEVLEEKIAHISVSEDRKVSRKERQDLKDDVIMELLPKAFTKSGLQFAYIDSRQGYIVIDAASAKKAEELLSALRECLGSLSVVPIISQQLPYQIMTHWLIEANTPENFTISDECELADPKEMGSVIRCKHQDLFSDEINNHLQAGMIATKLALLWREGIHFVLDDELVIKRLRFEDNIHEKVEGHNAQDAIELFDIEFSVMTLELSALITDLLKVLGGVNTESQSVEEIVARVDKQQDIPSEVEELEFSEA